MTVAAANLQDKVDELLTVLETDLEHIRGSLSHLNELRSLVVKRDDASLGKLLRQLQSESESYIAHQQERRAIRQQLARILNCGVEQITLSRLESVLPEAQSSSISELKRRLKSLAARLKREHASTVMLLTDLARFNSGLIRTIFDAGNADSITYGSDGAPARQTDVKFVNLQL